MALPKASKLPHVAHENAVYKYCGAERGFNVDLIVS